MKGIKDACETKESGAQRQTQPRGSKSLAKDKWRGALPGRPARDKEAAPASQGSRRSDTRPRANQATPRPPRHIHTANTESESEDEQPQKTLKRLRRAVDSEGEDQNDEEPSITSNKKSKSHRPSKKRTNPDNRHLHDEDEDNNEDEEASEDNNNGRKNRAESSESESSEEDNEAYDDQPEDDLDFPGLDLDEVDLDNEIAEPIPRKRRGRIAQDTGVQNQKKSHNKWESRLDSRMPKWVPDSKQTTNVAASLSPDVLDETDLILHDGRVNLRAQQPLVEKTIEHAMAATLKRLANESMFPPVASVNPGIKQDLIDAAEGNESQKMANRIRNERRYWKLIMKPIKVKINTIRSMHATAVKRTILSDYGISLNQTDTIGDDWLKDDTYIFPLQRNGRPALEKGYHHPAILRSLAILLVEESGTTTTIVNKSDLPVYTADTPGAQPRTQIPKTLLAYCTATVLMYLHKLSLDEFRDGYSSNHHFKYYTQVLESLDDTEAGQPSKFNCMLANLYTAVIASARTSSIRLPPRVKTSDILDFERMEG